MFYIDCAGFLVEIDNRFNRVERISRGLIVAPDEKSADIKLAVSDGDIEFERKLTPTASVEQLESLAFLRALAFELPRHDAFLFHASVFEYGGVAYAFTARSGVGKSTHTMLWKKLLGDKLKIICGDKSIIRIINGEVYAGATPWRGKEGFGEGGLAPLGAVAFINRLGEGEKNHVEAKNKLSVLTQLMTQTIIPPEEKEAEKFLSLLDCFIEKTEFYDIFCDMSDEAAEISIKALT